MRLGKDLLQDRVLVFGLLPSVFDLHVITDHAAFQWSWTIQRGRRNDVVEMIGLHLLQQVANAATFQLKDALGFAPTQEREGWLVVQRKLQRIDGLTRRLLDQVESR